MVSFVLSLLRKGFIIKIIYIIIIVTTFIIT